jgi:anaerobic ribonucleoside-triphosphate reductase activating protein
MLVHGKLESTTVNGPGVRAALWVAGCTLNCTGCHNPATHQFDASKETPLAALQTWILNLDGIEGITISGGEPLQHFAELLPLLQFVRDVRPELSLGIFTGYTPRELETGNWNFYLNGAMHPGCLEFWERLRGLLDFAVMGRFNASKLTTIKPLCGSSNQDVFLFSDRYRAGDFTPQSVDVVISPDGSVSITGFPGVEFIQGISKL